MKRLFSLVGRAGFEPATNGLKVRYALRALRAFRGGTGSHGRPDAPFLPSFCQNLPTIGNHLRMSRRAVFTNAVQGRTGWLKIQLVNVRRHEDNSRARAHKLPRFQPLRRACVAARERSNLWVFAFQGWCFVELWRSLVARLQSTRKGKAELAVAGSNPASSTKHHPPSGRELTQLTGQCRGCTHIPMALCEPRRRETCRRYSHEQATHKPCTFGPRYGRLEVECGPSGSGSPYRTVQRTGWPKWQWDASGLAILWSELNKERES